jgi:hypothetical protein
MNFRRGNLFIIATTHLSSVREAKTARATSLCTWLVKFLIVPRTLFEDAKPWIRVVDELIEEIYCIVRRKDFAIGADHVRKRCFRQDVFSEFVPAELATWFERRWQTCIARRPRQALRKGEKEGASDKRPSEEHGC